MDHKRSRSSPEDVVSAFVAELFGARDAITQLKLETEIEHVQLSRGENLFEQGETGDSMYLLVEGKLGVRLQKADGSEMVIGEEDEPGTSIGEMSLLTGQPRAVTVYALADSQLVKFSEKGFDSLAATYPQALAEFAQTITMPRWKRVQLALVLTGLFGELEPEVLLELQDELEWQQLEHGEVLFHQGDPGDAMYFVVNGRLRVVVMLPEGRERLIGEIGPGEIVGEFALLAGEDHSATVYAIRETDVFILTQPIFNHLVDQYPQAMMRIARLIIQRQRQTLKITRAVSAKALTLALVPTSPATPMIDFAHRFAESLAHFGGVLHLDSACIDDICGKDGAATMALDDPMSLILAGWMSEQETKFDYLLYVADPTWSAWTQRCVCQADRLLLVAQPVDDPEPGPVEIAIRALETSPRTELVLLHPAHAASPSRTSDWLTPRQVHTHHHVRIDKNGHFHRLARRVAGRTSGLVLSGGAARGFAHLGVFRALEELGIPVDRVGGTSMGALLGAGLAMGHGYEGMVELAKDFANPKMLFDYTFPFTSIMASHKVTHVMQEVFGELNIEDLWRPFFCVSSNLSRAEPVVHESGSLWKCVRTSIAIPGVFTPMLHEGDVLVDGGVMNNFPVNIMRELCEGGTVIGVNVSPPQERFEDYQFGSGISGWRVLWSRINPFTEPIRVPALASSVIRALEVDSVYMLKTIQGLADVLIQPDVAGFASLDFSAYEPISQIGYQAALEQLGPWHNEQRSI